MKNKAFTLIELLAAIVVLGIILAIVIPKAFSTLDISKEEIYKMKEGNLIKSAREYTLYYNTAMPSTIGQRIKVGLVELTDNDFVSEIYDLDDETLCLGYVYITKTNTENYEYLPCLFCTNYQTSNANCLINDV